MSINDYASQDPHDENTEIIEGTLRRAELGDALANDEQGKVLAPKVARKAKSQSNVPWFTHERMVPLWKIIADKFTWQNIKEVTNDIVDTFLKYVTAGASSILLAKAKKTEAEADAIRIKAEADAEKTRAEAKDISANADLKQELRKSIQSREKELRKERRSDPKSVVKPSKQLHKQLHDEGVAWEVRRDKQGNLVAVVTLVQSEEYPSE